MVFTGESKMIESYSFGKMKIDGKVYLTDLIVFPASVDPSWWREEGHNLKPQDLKAVLKEKPDILVIGTGYFGMMKMDAQTIILLKKEKIEFEADKTARAVEFFNEIAKNKKAIGVFHLTC
jgi:hypothetical protein